MKKWLLLVPPAAWVLSQALAPPPSPVARFPRGALAVVEAKDFSALWKAWNGSQAKREWLAGDAYRVFLNSRLGQRLSGHLDEFAAAAKFPLDSGLASQLAGTRTAVAVYNIGDLEVLAVTRMPAAAFALTALGQRRASLQPRNANGTPYFVSSDAASGRVFAFGFQDGWAVAGTSETLVAGFLANTGAGLAAEPWYANAVAASAGEGEARLVVHLEALQKSPYFRSYWIQRNRTELSAYGSAVSDLHQEAGAWTERRVLLRTQAGAPAQAGFDWPALLRAVPANAGLYRAWANPEPGMAGRLIAGKLMQPGPGSGSPEERFAPGPSVISEAGAESNWETRIDEAPFVDPATGPDLARLERWIAENRPSGLLHAQSTRDQPGGVWIAQDIGLVLTRNGAWDPAGVRAALPGVEYAIDGGRLFLGNSAAAVAAMRSANSGGTAPGEASFAAGFRHGLERQRYARWMARIEQPHVRPLTEGEPRQPEFLDDVVPALSRSLAGVAEQTVIVTETPAATRQAVSYRMAP